MKTNTYCKVTITRYELKEGTKTVYQEISIQEDIFTEEQYNNCVNASKFFRRLGGSEYQSKTYTSKGFKVVEIISKSPDRKQKTVRRFNFECLEIMEERKLASIKRNKARELQQQLTA